MQRSIRPVDEASLGALLARAGESLGAGNMDAAIRILQEATRLAPGSAPIQHDLGYLCLQAGRLREAIDALRIALLLDPHFAQASLCLGIALQEHGDAAAALGAYRGAVALNPELAAAHVCLGALLESLGETASAIAAFRAGAAAVPASNWSRLSLARALLAEDCDLEAEPVLRELCTLEPSNAMAQDMLATVLANTGRFAEARVRFENAIAASPKLAGNYYDLVRCRRITHDDMALVAQMESALQRNGTSTDTRVKLHLAMGKALDDLDDPAAAMPHFDQADSLRGTLLKFDLNAFEARVERLISYFTAERFAHAAHEDADATAVLVMGLPRSGTTLLEQILAGHPQAHGAGEQPFWIKTGPKWEATLTHSAGSFDFSGAGERYLSSLRTLAPQSRRIVDKMPLNILWAGLIHLTMPAATLIYCRRSPIDTALSIHRTYFNPRLGFPTGGAALVATIRAVERLAAQWRRVLPRDRFIEVDYEELVVNTRPVVEQLLVACGLAWDEACLRPEQHARLIKTPSKWQARQPIHRGSVDSWRRYQPWLGELAALLQQDVAVPPPGGAEQSHHRQGCH